MINKRITQINLKHLIFNTEVIRGSDGFFAGVSLKFFEKDSNEVYTKSYRNNFEVAHSFHHIKLNFSMRELMSLMTSFVEGVSQYLYNIRYELVGEEHLETRIKLNKELNKGDEYELVISNNRKKVRKFDKNDKEHGLTRYKVMISIHRIVEGKSIELVELRFTRRDVVLMMNAIKYIVDGDERVFNFIYSNAKAINDDKDVLMDPELMSISKIDNSIVFGDIFLHGQEILNLYYLINTLLFDPKADKILNSLSGYYRQVEFFKYNDFMMGIRLRKMQREIVNYEEKFSMADQPGKELMINNRMIAGLFLFNTMSQLKHASIIENEKDTQKYGSKVSYHVNMIESDVAVGFTKSKLKKKKTDGEEYMSFFSLGILSKKRMSEEGHEGFIKHHNRLTNREELVPVLQSASLSLHGKWIYFLETITKANNQEFDLDESVIRKRLHIIKPENGGRKKYTIGLYSDIENKAPLVLSIEKYEYDSDYLLEKFRQPMFEKYIKEFLFVAMQSAYDVDNFKFSTQKELSDIIGVEYKDIKTHNVGNVEVPSIELIPSGQVIKIGIEKINNTLVVIGEVDKKEKRIELDSNDIFLLNMSAANRIIYGKWIPFVGENIAISQDGFLTDLYSEVDLERRGLGAYHAWQYFFGTSIKKR